MESPKCIDAAGAGCGEGILWDAHRECLWWVDISGKVLHQYHPATGGATRLKLPWLISALALRDDGAMLIATARGLGIVDTTSGDIVILHNPETEVAGNRLNDMIAGPDGALWVGTMSEGAKRPSGALYRYNADGAQKILTGTTISNGLAWSPDGKRLYFVDSVPGVLHLYERGHWRKLRYFDSTTGRPDGLTVDSRGTLWVAMCDRGQIVGLNPDGEIIARIEVPCEIVTNCTFGGPNMATLFITTGTFSMTAAEKAANPQAGGLFAVCMDVPGLLPYKAEWPR